MISTSSTDPRRLQEIISDGPVSTVTRIESESPDGSRFMAVKTTTTTHAKEPHDIIKEVRLLASLSHPNVRRIITMRVRLHDSCNSDRSADQARSIPKIQEPEIVDAIHSLLPRRAPPILPLLPTPHRLLWKHHHVLLTRRSIHHPCQVGHLPGYMWRELPPQRTRPNRTQGHQAEQHPPDPVRLCAAYRLWDRLPHGRGSCRENE